MGEEVPLDEFVEEDEVLGDMLKLILAFLLDIDPLLSLGDKLEFLLDDLEEFVIDVKNNSKDKLEDPNEFIEAEIGRNVVKLLRLVHSCLLSIYVLECLTFSI